MSRFVKWATLTPHERSQVLPPLYNHQPAEEGGRGVSPSPSPTQHSCSVSLPDGFCCRVRYTRHGPRAHRFGFEAPLHQTLYVMASLSGSVAGIEARAQELAAGAFRQAQQAEQKAMQRATPPFGSKATRPAEASRCKAKVAQALAGQYAVCLRFCSGRLLCLGAVYAQPEGACEAWAQGRYTPVTPMRGQQIVIGIFCRWQRGWQQAQFVACPAPSVVCKPFLSSTEPTEPVSYPPRGQWDRTEDDEESEAWGREAEEDTEDGESENDVGAVLCSKQEEA